MPSVPQFGHVQRPFDVWVLLCGSTNFRCLLVCYLLGLLTQIVWVLYGQASRAISTG